MVKTKNLPLTVLFELGSELLGSERPAAAHVPYGSEPPHPGQILGRISAGTSCSFEAGGNPHGMSLLHIGVLCLSPAPGAVTVALT